MRHSEAWEGPGDEEEEVWRHRHGPRRRGPRGPGGPGGRGWGMRETMPGPPPDFGPWFGGPRMRGPRVKRGDVRAAALALLADGPRNGYQIIQAFLKTNKIDPASVTIVPVQFDPAPLVNGEVDAFMSFLTNQPIQLELKGIANELKPASRKGG